MIEQRARLVPDLGLLLPRISGSAKFRAAPALLAGTKETEACRRRSKAFDWSCPDCGWCVPEESPRAWLLAKQHAWAARWERHLSVMIFGMKGVRAAVKKSRELLKALRTERRPECAHQLTGETKVWKVASARAPTRLYRCAVCEQMAPHGSVSPSALLESCGVLTSE